MDMFEKVDKIRERMNVSHEEAKDALDSANGDVLQATILLERAGRSYRESNEAFSTNYAVNTAACCEKQTEEKKKNGRSFGEKMKELFRKSTVNYLAIEHDGKNIFKIPVFAVALILIFAWHAAIIAVVVSLFCGCKYSFVGEGELETANNFCSKAGELATQVKDKVVEVQNSLEKVHRPV